MPIHVLDQHTAELIAAGEVVERPSSVVKELVENAIDAGASKITIEIERGGINLISVQDNGSGIESDEIPTAFLRHATSKVQTEEDLNTISTLGFRGEALASIASVSQVELLTKTQTDEFASLYTIHGGQEQELTAGARPQGTTFTIRNLFYNTPARMKFLKKDASEGTFVTETVTRLALSHPEIAFTYMRENKQIFSTPGDGKLESASYAVLGRDFTKDLVEVDSQTGNYSVHGIITPPRASRASRSMQFFFINGRFVKNRTMMAALEQAYRGTVMTGKFPGCVLFLQMPTELVDVNVHPAKTEVRFAREGDVFDAVYKACKAALLGNSSNHNQLSFAQKSGEEIPESAIPTSVPTASPETATIASTTTQIPNYTSENASDNISRIKAYNNMVSTLSSDSAAVPYQTQSFPQNNTPPSMPIKEYGLTIENDEAEDDFPPTNHINTATDTYLQKEPVLSAKDISENASTPWQGEQTAFDLPEPAANNELHLIGEVFKTYILAQQGDMICFIDKHAAHERILFEQLMQTRGKTPAQQLLSPVAVVLSAQEKNSLLQNKEVLLDAGIEIDEFGGNEILIRAVPADVEPESVEDLIIEVAQRMSLNSKDTMNEKTEWVLHSVSCRAAVKAGDKTTTQELLQLATDILTEKVPPFCPHGRPIVLEITRKELEKQFGRLG